MKPTDQQFAEIARLARAGMPPKEIAARVQCDRRVAVDTVAKLRKSDPRIPWHKRGPQSRVTDEERATIKRMQKRGVKYRDIAAAVGMPLTNVAGIIRAFQDAGELEKPGRWGGRYARTK